MQLLFKNDIRGFTQKSMSLNFNTSLGSFDIRFFQSLVSQYLWKNFLNQPMAMGYELLN